MQAEHADSPSPLRAEQLVRPQYSQLLSSCLLSALLLFCAELRRGESSMRSASARYARTGEAGRYCSAQPCVTHGRRSHQLARRGSMIR